MLNLSTTPHAKPTYIYGFIDSYKNTKSIGHHETKEQ